MIYLFLQMYFSTLLPSQQLYHAVLSGRLDAAEHQRFEEVSGEQLCAVWGRHLSAQSLPSPPLPPLPSRISLPSGSVLKSSHNTNNSRD